jgi:HEPN domain-containing protein
MIINKNKLIKEISTLSTNDLRDMLLSFKSLLSMKDQIIELQKEKQNSNFFKERLPEIEECKSLIENEIIKRSN